jgi:hypothetical protein
MSNTELSKPELSNTEITIAPARTRSVRTTVVIAIIIASLGVGFAAGRLTVPASNGAGTVQVPSDTGGGFPSPPSAP